MNRGAEIPFVVKVCGITNEEDALVSAEAGANALGFNFYERSARYIRPEAARNIARNLPEGTLRVGVFVNASEAAILQTTREVALDVVQLHGENAAAVQLRVWRAVAAGRAIPKGEVTPEAYLLDAYTPKYGGSGNTFDWRSAASYPGRLILAGGLDGANVAEAIEAARPWGVDACSRLERCPGKKDANRVREFVSAALKSLGHLDARTAQKR